LPWYSWLPSLKFLTPERYSRVDFRTHSRESKPLSTHISLNQSCESLSLYLDESPRSLELFVIADRSERHASLEIVNSDGRCCTSPKGVWLFLFAAEAEWICFCCGWWFQTDQTSSYHFVLAPICLFTNSVISVTLWHKSLLFRCVLLTAKRAYSQWLVYGKLATPQSKPSWSLVCGIRRRPDLLLIPSIDTAPTYF
jgi:hypothetical protein